MLIFFFFSIRTYSKFNKMLDDKLFYCICLAGVTICVIYSNVFCRTQYKFPDRHTAIKGS